MNDEGFREIQLNGKQLVFLFMAATVVSVVIFLCGVLVGRGARSERPSADMSASVAPDDAVATISPPSSGAAEGVKPGSDNLSYTDRLLGGNTEEKLKAQAPAVQEPVAPAPQMKPVVSAPPEATSAPASAPAAAPKASPTAKPAPSAKPSAAPPAVASADPSGPGFAVQVMIFENRREADVLAKQLIGKGYPAFVLDPAKGTPKPIYRVRVGKYKNRKDAEEISARLERDEQFKPWIAR